MADEYEVTLPADLSKYKFDPEIFKAIFGERHWVVCTEAGTSTFTDQAAAFIAADEAEGPCRVYEGHLDEQGRIVLTLLEGDGPEELRQCDMKPAKGAK